jgi:hypothetical protein
LGRCTAWAGLCAIALSRTAVSSTPRRTVYAVRIEDSASPRPSAQPFHASMWDGLSLSSGLAPIPLPTMCVRAIALYRFFVVAFRSDASSAALLDLFVPKHGRCVVKVVNLSSNRVRGRVPECTRRPPGSHSVGHSAVWSSMARLLADRGCDGWRLGVRAAVVS